MSDFLVRVSRVVLVELFRAIGAIEFMAFARHTHQRNGHQQQGENFHRGAS